MASNTLRPSPLPSSTTASADDGGGASGAQQIRTRSGSDSRRPSVASNLNRGGSAAEEQIAHDFDHVKELLSLSGPQQAGPGGFAHYAFPRHFRASIRHSQVLSELDILRKNVIQRIDEGSTSDFGDRVDDDKANSHDTQSPVVALHESQQKIARLEDLLREQETSVASAKRHVEEIESALDSKIRDNEYAMKNNEEQQRLNVEAEEAKSRNHRQALEELQKRHQENMELIKEQSVSQLKSKDEQAQEASRNHHKQLKEQEKILSSRMAERNGQIELLQSQHHQQRLDREQQRQQEVQSAREENERQLASQKSHLSSVKSDLEKENLTVKSKVDELTRRLAEKSSSNATFEKAIEDIKNTNERLLHEEHRENETLLSRKDQEIEKIKQGHEESVKSLATLYNRQIDKTNDQMYRAEEQAKKTQDELLHPNQIHKKRSWDLEEHIRSLTEAQDDQDPGKQHIHNKSIPNSSKSTLETIPEAEATNSDTANTAESQRLKENQDRQFLYGPVIDDERRAHAAELEKVQLEASEKQRAVLVQLGDLQSEHDGLQQRWLQFQRETQNAGKAHERMIIDKQKESESRIKSLEGQMKIDFQAAEEVYEEQMQRLMNEKDTAIEQAESKMARKESTIQDLRKQTQDLEISIQSMTASFKSDTADQDRLHAEHVTRLQRQHERNMNQVKEGHEAELSRWEQKRSEKFTRAKNSDNSCLEYCTEASPISESGHVHQRDTEHSDRSLEANLSQHKVDVTRQQQAKLSEKDQRITQLETQIKQYHLELEDMEQRLSADATDKSVPLKFEDNEGDKLCKDVQKDFADSIEARSTLERQLNSMSAELNSAYQDLNAFSNSLVEVEDRSERLVSEIKELKEQLGETQKYCQDVDRVKSDLLEELTVVKGSLNTAVREKRQAEKISHDLLTRSSPIPLDQKIQQRPATATGLRDPKGEAYSGDLKAALSEERRRNEELHLRVQEMQTFLPNMMPAHDHGSNVDHEHQVFLHEDLRQSKRVEREWKNIRYKSRDILSARDRLTTEATNKVNEFVGRRSSLEKTLVATYVRELASARAELVKEFNSSLAQLGTGQADASSNVSYQHTRNSKSAADTLQSEHSQKASTRRRVAAPVHQEFQELVHDYDEQLSAILGSGNAKSMTNDLSISPDLFERFVRNPRRNAVGLMQSQPIETFEPLRATAQSSKASVRELGGVPHNQISKQSDSSSTAVASEPRPPNGSNDPEIKSSNRISGQNREINSPKVKDFAMLSELGREPSSSATVQTNGRLESGARPGHAAKASQVLELRKTSLDREAERFHGQVNKSRGFGEVAEVRKTGPDVALKRPTESSVKPSSKPRVRGMLERSEPATEPYDRTRPIRDKTDAVRDQAPARKTTTPHTQATAAAVPGNPAGRGRSLAERQSKAMYVRKR